MTPKQKRKIQKLLKYMCDYSGYERDEMTAYVKSQIKATGPFYNISDSKASDAIDFLVGLIIENGVQVDDMTILKSNDTNKYLWHCLKNRVCCVCGAPNADCHHEDAIGMGRDREKYDDSNHNKLALCRKHHNMAHSMGKDTFRDKFKVYGIIFKEE